MQPPLSQAAVATAAGHLADVLEHAIEHGPGQRALVVWDVGSALAVTLAEAYRRCLPGAAFLQFDTTEPEAVRYAFEAYGAGDLVVLIQSTSFRLGAFRIRLELFRRGLKVVEHPHLARMPGGEGLIYIDALAYDRAYFRGTGRALQERITRAGHGVVESGGAVEANRSGVSAGSANEADADDVESNSGSSNLGNSDPVNNASNSNDSARLIYPAGFEPAKVNIGDYTGMRNVGGQFPIGEVFTESADLEAVHGRVRITHFGDTTFSVNRPAQPITLVVERGRVVRALDATPEFERVLAEIRAEEGEVWLRELGFGLNRALTAERTVTDIGTYERMCGVHLSLGAKHATYNKPQIRKKTARFHVDVFAQTERVLLDGDVVFRDGAWVV